MLVESLALSSLSSLRLSKALDKFELRERRRLLLAEKYVIIWRSDDHLVPPRLAELRREMTGSVWTSCQQERLTLLLQCHQLKSYFQSDMRKEPS